MNSGHLVVLCANLVLPTTLGCFGSCPMGDDAVADASADFDQARAALLLEAQSECPDWLAQASECPQDLIAGRCGDDGPLFTFRWLAPFTWQYDYFAGTDGRFIGRTIGQGEIIIPFPCAGGGYWPWTGPIRCDNKYITEVLSGTRYQVGEAGDVLP